MLHDFISSRRAQLIARAGANVSAWPSPPSGEQPEQGVSLFLAQLAETLRLEATAVPVSPTAIGAGAARHGRELLAGGFSLAQAVHDYADVGQAITELAAEHGATISPAELHTLIRCLDAAIAAAVSEYGRLKEEATTEHDLRHRGQIAHELRNFVQTALLAVKVIQGDNAGASSSAGGMLCRSLGKIRELVDSIVSDDPLAAVARRHARVSLLRVVEEVAVAAGLQAQSRDVRLSVEPVDPRLAIEVDVELVETAVMNLVHNALQYTHAQGQVTIRAHADHGRAFIDVEDECGGLGRSEPTGARPSGDAPGSGRTGLALSRRAVTASGGEIHARDLPGKGCVFSVDLPLAALAAPRSPIEEPRREARHV